MHWRSRLRKIAALLAAMFFGLAAMSACASGTAHAPAADVTTEGCEGPAREFDFWLGEWTIEQQILAADGTWLSLPATTSVSLSPSGCVYTEHWIGHVQFFWEGMAAPAATWGYSARAFDPELGAWRIYWMDGRNPKFDAPYIGGFEGDRGVFLRELETESGPRTMRIAFSRLGEGELDWELAISSDQGEVWTTLWRMHMRSAGHG
jgi:hypothetical protein